MFSKNMEEDGRLVPTSQSVSSGQSSSSGSVKEASFQPPACVIGRKILPCDQYRGGQDPCNM